MKITKKILINKTEKEIVYQFVYLLVQPGKRRKRGRYREFDI